MERNLPPWATINPNAMGPGSFVRSVCGGTWRSYGETGRSIPDPMTGEALFSIDVVDEPGFMPFIDRLRDAPSYGRFNPHRGSEQYVNYGNLCFLLAAAMRDPHVREFFVALGMKVMPKSRKQHEAEYDVTRKMVENFSGDNVRFMMRGTITAGDRLGQQAVRVPWPLGRAVIICPFNFALEIPVLQVIGALISGNHVLVKVDSRVAPVFEQFLRLMHHVGFPVHCVDMICTTGEMMGKFLQQAEPFIDVVQFTGSTEVAELVTDAVRGKVRLEDSGFDWAVFGTDAYDHLQYVAWQADQDAFAASGQKCSARSIELMPAFMLAEYIAVRAELAARRNIGDLTIGPCLSVTTEQMQCHVDALLRIPGAKLHFGGKPLTEHAIPECYGVFQPTLIEVPLLALLDTGGQFRLITKEVFGPIQVIVGYNDAELIHVLDILERIQHRLTAAVVSNNPDFITRVLGVTTNGTTYVGIRSRTTGAPQNHDFGPTGARAASIGTPEAIIHTFTSSRTIVYDTSTPNGWTLPDAT